MTSRTRQFIVNYNIEIFIKAWSIFNRSWRKLIKNRIFRIIKKQSRQFLAVRKIRNNLSSFAMPNELLSLLNLGFVKFTNGIDHSLLTKWSEDYGIKKSNFLPTNGNISVPFFNAEMHALLTGSNLIDLLKDYFVQMYGVPPMLQMVPTLVITHPNVEQQTYIKGVQNFPAHWHYDYPSEFTIHIPLTKITIETTHTKYIKRSHLSLLSSPPTETSVLKDQIVSCFSVPGDVILFDVDGSHRAQLEVKGFRALIQLKFTAGNDILDIKSFSIPKMQKNILRTKQSYIHYEQIKKRLSFDKQYIQEQDTFNPMLTILNDCIQYYDFYL